MKYFILSFISLLLTIACVIFVVKRTNEDIYVDPKDEISCRVGKLKPKDKTCGVWSGDICFKGKCDNCNPLTGGSCTKQVDYVFRGVYIVAVVLFIIFIVMTALGFSKIGKK
jgi:hypothetical protein